VTDGWARVFLGAIALATLVMAAIQVGGAWYLSRLGRRLDRLLGRLEQELEPTVARLRTVGEEAARVARLAAAQMERVDRVSADLAARLDETAALIQQAIAVPARESLALVRALKVAVTTFRAAARRGHRSVPTEEPEEALFIG
jgi:hypothetical protein